MSNIMAISRLRVGTDGAGITTLVGFHGCPLNCGYCANNKCHSDIQPKYSYTPEELIDTVAVDSLYFQMTGGGITFGGGEPMTEAGFINDVCALIKNKWKKNVETSLYCRPEAIELLADKIDHWYVDIKEVDPAIYKSYTGKDNALVLSNLKLLISLAGCDKVCVRYPLIPEYNNENIRINGIDYLVKNISKNLHIELFEYKKILRYE